MVITCDKLKIILNQHPDVLSNHATLSSCLENIFPQQFAERRALVAAYDLGILDVLQKEQNNNIVCTRFILKMEEQYGIAPNYSEQAILVWSEFSKRFFNDL